MCSMVLVKTWINHDHSDRIQNHSVYYPAGTAGTNTNSRGKPAILTMYRGFSRESPPSPVVKAVTHRNPRQSFTIPTVIPRFPRESPQTPVGTQ